MYIKTLLFVVFKIYQLVDGKDGDINGKWYMRIWDHDHIEAELEINRNLFYCVYIFVYCMP